MSTGVATTQSPQRSPAVTQALAELPIGSSSQEPCGITPEQLEAFTPALRAGVDRLRYTRKMINANLDMLLDEACTTFDAVKAELVERMTRLREQMMEWSVNKEQEWLDLHMQNHTTARNMEAAYALVESLGMNVAHPPASHSPRP